MGNRNMSVQHAELASGRWQTLSLLEQMGNIGSEVGRARKWQGKDQRRFDGAVDRALDLMRLTLEDPRWHGSRLKELCRAHELFCDAVLGGGDYGTRLDDMERYFNAYAVAARKIATFLKT